MSCVDVKPENFRTFLNSSSTQSSQFFNHMEENTEAQDFSAVSGKSTLLLRIKYFEAKTNQNDEHRRSFPKIETGQQFVSHSIKNTIVNARARERYVNEEKVPTDTTNEKRNSVSVVRKPSLKTTVNVSHSKQNRFESDSRRSSGTSNHSGQSLYIIKDNSEDVSSKPTEKLSIKSTINKAREEAQRVNCNVNKDDGPGVKLKNEECTEKDNLDNHKNAPQVNKRATNEKENFVLGDFIDLNSTCNKFFSTGSIDCLPNYTEKQFRIVLRRYLYQNFFYSLQYFNQEVSYSLDDFYDYDLSDSELFEYYD